MNHKTNHAYRVSRRDFIRTSAIGVAGLASGALTGCVNAANSIAAQPTGPTGYTFSLNQDWLFGGNFTADALKQRFDDASFSKVTVPHCVAKLSWQNWDPDQWEDMWIYRRHFSLPKECRNRRVFLHFEGVMLGARPTFNDHALPEHLGGYLPFHYEITDWLQEQNVLALAVDSRWSNVPPEGSPKGPEAVDYLEPGGIHRPVSLRAVPQIFISDVFAKPVAVLDSSRRVEVTCSIDAAVVPIKPLRLKVELRDGPRTLATAEQPLTIEKSGETTAKLTLSNLGNIQLWHVDTPRLYDVVTTLILNGAPLHDCRTRVGFRDARFEVDGFFLNGQRFRLFGLDRHELLPYAGFAMPSRVMRRDAEILRREFNCNAVRCSHYPQSEAFLDACDELGLLVWQETPGWQYVGDDSAYQDLVVRNVEDMVRRDRNHPAVVIWGVRVNESRNVPALYQRTTAAAKALDDSRPTSGSMTSQSKKGWQQDVFALDDYHSAPDASVGIEPPVPGVPYMLAETVGQFSYQAKHGFNNKYRRAGDLDLQTHQALYHAEAHDRAAAFPTLCGVIAWCAFDYGSLMNSYNAVKCPGVADVFRIPKLGASFYRTQGNPATRPIILPSFYWDFGAKSPRGSGKNAAIFSNCDRLEVFVAGKQIAALEPDRKNFPNLKHPPFFCDLEFDGAHHPELRIDGYVDNKLALSQHFSSDPSQDQFFLAADDSELTGDGSDATRLVFKVVDKFGAERAFADGEVTFEISGPGTILGDNPFALADSGGVGAVWIKTIPNGSGQIVVNATHSSLGKKSVTIQVQSNSANQAEKILYANEPTMNSRFQNYVLDYDTPVDPALQTQLEGIDAALRSNYGMTADQTAVGLLDLRALRLAMLRPDHEEYAASVAKIGILLAWFQLNPTAAATLDAATRHELGLMIKASSNEMASKFSHQLGLLQIQSVLNSYHFYDAKHGGGLWLGKHYGADTERLGSPVGDNSHAATVRQLLRFYLLLEQRKLVSPAASEKMREVFESPDIPADDIKFVKALAGRDVQILRKWGSWENWLHDTAIITGPDRHYILVALTHHPRGDDYLVDLAVAVDASMAHV
jgi:beta-galactosidase